ncbi:MAG: LamG domain-containing protein [Pseudomonadota bacterium]
MSANGTAAASDAARARVMVNLMTDLPIGNSHRTIEFWAYIKTADWVGESNTIYEYGTQATTAAGFGLDFGAAEVTGMAGNHATLDPYTNGGFDNDSRNYLGITSTMNQWVHLAMTWDGTAVRTYVNGVSRITTTGAGMLATASTQLTIGCNNPRFSCFNGFIDEFRVWNVARSATEVMNTYNKALVGNETGLVGYWKFNEMSGTSVADSVTTAGHTAHNGTLTATAAGQNPTFVAPTPSAPIMCP